MNRYFYVVYEFSSNLRQVKNYAYFVSTDFFNLDTLKNDILKIDLFDNERCNIFNITYIYEFENKDDYYKFIQK